MFAGHDGRMRSVGVLLATAGATAMLVGGCGVAQANASGVWVQVSPGTISPGNAVKITASCGDSSNSATVTSLVFGTLTLHPQSALLIGQAMVPANSAPGTFSVDLTCKTGSSATTTLTVLGSTAAPTTKPPATVGPHTGGGFLANGGHGSAAPTLWIIGGLAAIGGATAIAIGPRRRRREPARAPSRRR
jgi:hypothetical protein